jgi:hypothetical protein
MPRVNLQCLLILRRALGRTTLGVWAENAGNPTNDLTFATICKNHASFNYFTKNNAFPVARNFHRIPSVKFSGNPLPQADFHGTVL